MAKRDKIFKVPSVSFLYSNYAPIFAKFSGHVTSIRVQCVSTFGAKSPYHLLMPASQRKDSPFFMLSNISSFNYDVIIGAAQSTISLSVLGSDQDGSLSDDNCINCYKRRTLTSV